MKKKRRLMISRLTDSQLDYSIDEFTKLKNKYCDEKKWEDCERLSRIIKKLAQQREERDG